MQSIKSTTCKTIVAAILFGILFTTCAFGQRAGYFRSHSILTINPSTVNFGSLTVGAISSPVTVTLSNQSSSNITITSEQNSLGQVMYSGPSLPVTIAPGQNILASLTFIPNAAQSYAGSLTFVQSNGSSVAAQISGVGLAAQAPPAAKLSLSSSSLAFGSEPLGKALDQTVTVSNTGGQSLTISGVTLAGPGFSVSGVSSGLILTAGQSSVLTVAFDPAASGSVTGSVSIATNVAGSQTISLSGTGAQQAASSVLLSWVPSTSSSVAGYNVYRATSSGGESKTSPVNGATTVAGATFTDTNIVAGTTYYYEVTAVTSGDTQSTDSNEASIVAP